MQDTCPFRGFRTRKANPVNLFRPPPPNSTAGGTFGAAPVVTPLSGSTAAPEARQGARGKRRKGASRLASGHQTTTQFGGKTAASPRFEEEMPGFFTALSLPWYLDTPCRFSDGAVALTGPSPACRILCHRPGMMVKDRHQASGCRLQDN